MDQALFNQAALYARDCRSGFLCGLSRLYSGYVWFRFTSPPQSVKNNSEMKAESCSAADMVKSRVRLVLTQLVSGSMNRRASVQVAPCWKPAGIVMVPKPQASNFCIYYQALNWLHSIVKDHAIHLTICSH